MMRKLSLKAGRSFTMASKKRITNVIINAALVTILLMISIMAFTVSTHAASSNLEATGYINSSNGAFMRARATTSSTIITGLRNNTPVVIQKEIFVSLRKNAKTKRWYYVTAGRYSGYVRADLIKKIKYKGETAKTDAKVKYRVGAGKLMKRAGYIYKNKRVKVVLQAKARGSTKVWYKIKYGSKYYYVISSHVKLANSTADTVIKADPADIVQTPAALNIAKKSANWARDIANDNTFHYGNGTHSHHNGCYFCGTQPKSKQKYVTQWEKTYCCNPFVTAAYAHGGNEPFMLNSVCSKGNSYMAPEFKKCVLFANLGHPSQDKLVKGDVLCASAHVAIYIGDGKIAEACTSDNGKPGTSSWNNSIKISTLTASRYSGFKAGVFRYIGDTTTNIADPSEPVDPDDPGETGESGETGDSGNTSN